MLFGAALDGGGGGGDDGVGDGDGVGGGVCVCVVGGVTEFLPSVRLFLLSSVGYLCIRIHCFCKPYIVTYDM
jgi:hypothetical protein